MVAPAYHLWVRDSTFGRIRKLTSFTSFTMIERDMAVGSWQLTIPDKAMTSGGGALLRDTNGAGIIVTQEGVTAPVFGGRLSSIEHNLGGFSRLQQAPTGTCVYAGGSDEGTARNFALATATASTKWPWRIEQFVDKRQTLTAELAAAATAALTEHAPTSVVEVDTSSNTATDEWVFTGPDDQVWLRDRIVIPQPATVTPPWATDVHHSITGVPTAVLNTLVGAHIGASSTGVRKLAAMSRSSTASGSSFTWSGRLENLLDAVQEIAHGKDIWWRIGTEVDGVNFDTKARVDRTADSGTPLVVSPQTRPVYRQDFYLGDLCTVRFDGSDDDQPCVSATTTINSNGTNVKVQFDSEWEPVEVAAQRATKPGAWGVPVSSVSNGSSRT